MLFEALGAVVTKIAWPELYMALAQKVVDGQENPLSAIYYQKFYEVQKSVALTRHTYSCSMVLMSTKSWKKLTAWQQFIVREEAIRAGNFVRKTLNNEESELIAKMEKAGVKITRPDPAPFREAAKPAYDKIFERYGQENVNIMMKFAEEAK
jgi:TRAP-type C4-dicarboxylate transport system substrate-binding protein